MRDQFPQLPDLPAEDLAELRTLDEIVQYMGKVGGANGTHANGNHSTTEANSPKALAPEVAANGGTAPALTQLQHDIPRVAAALKRLPQPDFMHITLPAGGVCVLTDDGTPLTALIAEKLSAQGWPVVVISFPADVVPTRSTLPPHIARVELADMAETRLEDALKTISTGHGPVAAFVHLSPPSRAFGANGDLFVDNEKALVKHAFLFAKHLKRPLQDSANAGYAAFVTVARLDGAFGTHNGLYSAISGGLFGLTKTVNLEWPGVFCRALDVATDLEDATAAQHIVAELHDPNRLTIDVAIRREGRATLIADVVI